MVMTVGATSPGLRATLAALATGSPVSIEVVLVERDPGAVDAQTARSVAVLVPAHEPLDPVMAINVGAEVARGAVLVLLAAGMRPRPGWLGPLLEAFSDPLVAVAAPVLVSPEGTVVEAGRVVWDDGSVWAAPTAPHGIADVDAVSFDCVAVRADAWRAHHGLDGGFTLPGLADVELCFRLRAAGHRVVVVPSCAVVTPFGGGAQGPTGQSGPAAPSRDPCAPGDIRSDAVRFRRRWESVLRDHEPSPGASGLSPSGDAARSARVVGLDQGWPSRRGERHDGIGRGGPPTATRYSLGQLMRPAAPLRVTVLTGTRPGAVGHGRAGRGPAANGREGCDLGASDPEGHPVGAPTLVDGHVSRRLGDVDDELDPDRLSSATINDRAHAIARAWADAGAYVLVDPAGVTAAEDDPDVIWMVSVGIVRRHLVGARRRWPRAVVVADPVVVTSVWAAHLALLHAGDPTAQRLADQARARERWWLGHPDLVASAAPHDTESLVALLPGVPVTTVLDPVSARPPAALHGRQGLVWWADFTRDDHVDGAHWLCREVLPRVQWRRPGTGATIIGADPPPSVLALAGGGVTVRSDATVDVVVDGARVGVCPLRYGSGAAIGTVRVIAAGVPVVATSVGLGAVGLQSVSGETAADDADSFAQAVVDLLGSDERWLRVSATAQQQVVSARDPAVVGAHINSVVRGLMDSTASAAAG